VEINGASYEELLRRCLLADHPEQELLIYRYLLLEAEQGKRIDGMLAHSVVASAWKLSQQVGREAHRYLGFVQFQQLWRNYFQTLAVPERKNLKLQQGKVPLKARGFLTEFG